VTSLEIANPDELAVLTDLLNVEIASFEAALVARAFGVAASVALEPGNVEGGALFFSRPQGCTEWQLRVAMPGLPAVRLLSTSRETRILAVFAFPRLLKALRNSRASTIERVERALRECVELTVSLRKEIITQ
jgi:hypothetical protein